MTSTIALVKASVAVAALSLVPTLARAQDRLDADAPAGRLGPLPISVRLEPGLALAITEPQSQRTDAGFAQTIKLFLGITRFLDIGPTSTFTTLPASSAMADAGANAGNAWNVLIAA
jgi:hypothetical protein